MNTEGRARFVELFIRHAVYKIEKRSDTETSSATGRLGQDAKRSATSCVPTRHSQSRQHLMERSFARATRYGFKRARWRRLWRVQIQEFLISAIQNIMVLLSYGKSCGRAQEGSLSFAQKLSSVLHFLFVCIQNAIFVFNNILFLYGKPRSMSVGV